MVSKYLKSLSLFLNVESVHAAENKATDAAAMMILFDSEGKVSVKTMYTSRSARGSVLLKARKDLSCSV